MQSEISACFHTETLSILLTVTHRPSHGTWQCSQNAFHEMEQSGTKKSS